MDLNKYYLEFGEDESKYLQLVAKIKDMIISGKLEYDEKLPAIRSLSNKLNISNATVVRVYNILEQAGYISKRKGSGTYVSYRRKITKNIDLDNKDMYRLDGGRSPVDIFPVEDFKRAINTAVEEDFSMILAYDDGDGLKELKKSFSKYLSKFKIMSREENIMVISGGQQGIDIVCKSLINYSDPVFIESPSYSGAIEVLKSRGAKIISIPMLSDGLDIGILKLKLEKIRPKLLYVMPNFQNPTGISYSTYKKKKLIELAQEYDFYILEDDFISDFRFMSEDNMPMKTYDTYNRVIYIKSFSKILMPGLRLGLMNLPLELSSRMHISKYSTDISTSPLIQKAMYYYMEMPAWKENLMVMEKNYCEKYKLANKYIRSRLDGLVSIVENDGGLNFFIELRRGYYSRDFVDFIYKKGVVVQSGAKYFDNDIDDRYFRVNIVSENISRIREAINIIRQGLIEFYDAGK